MGTCVECKSKNIVEDYTDGSLVCTACGLVASHFLLDDRPIMDECRLVHYDSQILLSDAILAMYEDHIPKPTLVLAEDACIKLASHKYDPMCLRAACIYHAWKTTKAGGIICNVDDICNLFHACKSKVIDIYGKHFVQDHIPNVRSKYNGLASLVIDSRVRCKILTACCQLETTLSVHPETANKKPSKMCAAIFYWCCKHNCVQGVSVQDVCKEANVSKITFKKHLKMIDCVQKCKNT